MKDVLYLEISRKDENLEICLSKGEQTVAHYEECKVPSKDLQRRSSELLHLLNSVSRQGKIPPIIFQELQQIGQVLYNEIFPITIKKELADTSAEDLLLKIDNRLVQIPWELMFTGQEFFCERFNVGRMVKTQQILSNVPQRKLRSPLKMLIIADPKGDLHSAYEEGQQIRESLNIKAVTITVVSSEVSIDFLKKKLVQFDLIHYAGHADYDLSDPSSSGWILEDGKFTALDIRKLSGVSPMPSIVFSNACQSGTTEEWQVGESSEEKIYGLANAFLLSGVHHYIGTFWKVLDKPSTHFAIEFYRQIFSGQNIGMAMRSARRALKEHYGQDNVFWASYLLYGDPTTHYFDLYKPQSVQTQPAYYDARYEKLGLPQDETIAKDWHPVTDLLIQEKTQSGVLWKTRSPSELMERALQVEQEYQNRPCSKATLSKGKQLRWQYVVYPIAIVIVLGFIGLLSHSKRADVHQSSPFKPLGGELMAGKSTNSLLNIDWTDENSLSRTIQKIMGAYKPKGEKGEEADEWTSRPLTIFFTEGRENQEAETATLVHNIMKKLQEHPRITILERENLEIILQELALSSSELVESSSALRQGKMLAGSLITTCNLYRIGSTLQINMRLIENETTIVKAALSEEWGNSTSTDEMAERVNKKITKAINDHYPLRGRIKAVLDYNRVTINIGNRHGLQKGMKFNVIKNTAIYKNGEVISEEDVKVGEIEVDEVRSDHSFLKVLGRSEDLIAGMKVTPPETPTQN